MFDDPHLNASGGLETVILPDGSETKLPLLPIEMDGRRLGNSPQIPQSGADSWSLLQSLGYAVGDVEAMMANNFVQ
jgi:crotonobetainyl-CoA:carnitine CoA-transferase CaiB-like acyl-CoA transferase